MGGADCGGSLYGASPVWTDVWCLLPPTIRLTVIEFSSSRVNPHAQPFHLVAESLEGGCGLDRIDGLTIHPV
jgi:hypothetical protein